MYDLIGPLSNSSLFVSGNMEGKIKIVWYFYHFFKKLLLVPFLFL